MLHNNKLQCAYRPHIIVRMVKNVRLLSTGNVVRMCRKYVQIFGEEVFIWKTKKQKGL
jgi:hypothetical protein